MGSNKPCRDNKGWLFAVCLGCVATAAPVLAEPIQAEYFTDSRQYPMTGDSSDAAVTRYDLAAPVLLEQSFSIGLPADPQKAEAMAKAWFKDTQAKLSGQLEAAYASHAKALNYNLKKYPAWVFDGRAIVYGVTGLREGLAIYKAWLSNPGNAQSGTGNPP